MTETRFVGGLQSNRKMISEITGRLRAAVGGADRQAESCQNQLRCDHPETGTEGMCTRCGTLVAAPGGMAAVAQALESYRENGLTPETFAELETVQASGRDRRAGRIRRIGNRHPSFLLETSQHHPIIPPPIREERRGLVIESEITSFIPKL